MADGNVQALKRAPKSLTAALIAVQEDVGDIAKDTKGARGKYAPLDAVLSVVRPALNRHGIAFVQTPGIEGEWMVVRTVLRHVSGETLEGVYPVCSLGKAPQDTGSALTYARRYSLLSVCGVHPTDEDDDGERGAAVARPPQQPKPDNRIADIMRRTLDMTTTQQELATWLAAHKDNMGKIPPAVRDALRADYAERLRSLPDVDHDTGEVVDG